MLLPKAEGKWLASLRSEDRVLFLATLAHQLAVASRDSYRPSTSELSRLQLLRKINAVQLRVTAWLRSELKKPADPASCEALGRIVLNGSEVELAQLLSWAWSEAKDVSLTSRTVADLE